MMIFWCLCTNWKCHGTVVSVKMDQLKSREDIQSKSVLETHFNIFTQWFCSRFHHSGIFLLIANFCSLFFSFGVFWLPESYKEPWWILWGGSLKRHQSTSICTKFSIINGLSEKNWLPGPLEAHIVTIISHVRSYSHLFLLSIIALVTENSYFSPRSSGGCEWSLVLVLVVCEVFLWLFFFGSWEENAVALGRQLESHVSMT